MMKSFVLIFGAGLSIYILGCMIDRLMKTRNLNKQSRALEESFEKSTQFHTFQ